MTDVFLGPENPRIRGVSGNEETSLNPLRGEWGRKTVPSSSGSQVTRSSREVTLLDSNRVSPLIRGTRSKPQTQFAR